MAGKCFELAKRCQHIEAKLDWPFNWTRQFSRLWLRDYSFDTGVVVRPAGEPTGFEYLCTSGGRTGAEEPAWPRVIGGSVTDGSLTWQAQAISFDSLIERIATDNWTHSPTGIEVEPVAKVDTAGLQQTAAICSLGAVGETYVIENEVITTNGLEYMARLELTIE
jgi:hypothetical protein